MSLMFAALRTLDGERPVAAAQPPRVRRLPAALWPGALWLGAGALLGGAVMAWSGWPGSHADSAALAADPASAPQLLQMAPVPAMLALDPAGNSVAAPLPASDVSGARTVAAVAAKPDAAVVDGTPTAPAPAASASVTATPAAPVAAATTTTAVDAPAPTTTSAPHGFAPLPPGSLVVRDAAPVASSPAAHAPTSGEPGEPDAASVARRVEAMSTAIDSGDFEAAQAQLLQLQHLLPAQSLTLLRMQAYLAQRRGDDAQALPLYRQIVTRMPGDRGAAINLALLEANAGQLDEARQRLRVLQAGDGGGSEDERQALARAMAQVGASP